jgi:hypothetical protein
MIWSKPCSMRNRLRQACGATMQHGCPLDHESSPRSFQKGLL